MELDIILISTMLSLTINIKGETMFCWNNLFSKNASDRPERLEHANYTRVYRINETTLLICKIEVEQWRY